MNKWSIIICLFFFLAVLLSGCTQTPPAPAVKYVCADGKTTVTDITTCPPSVGAKELTEEEKALEVCKGMPSVQGVSAEDICIIGVAGKYKDTSICTEVSRDQRLNCYVLIAELKNDTAICAEAGSMIDQCYDQYATNKRDSSICAKITDMGYKDSCYEKLAGQLSDPALCNKILNVNQKDNCYSNMAMRLGDSSYCEKITNSNQKQSCITNMQGRSGENKPSYPS